MLHIFSRHITSNVHPTNESLRIKGYIRLLHNFSIIDSTRI